MPAPYVDPPRRHTLLGCWNASGPPHLMVKPFHELNEKELLALAIASEEEDSKIYGSFAEKVRAEFPATAELLDSMQEQESDHRRQLIVEAHAPAVDAAPHQLPARLFAGLVGPAFLADVEGRDGKHGGRSPEADPD